MSGCNDSCTVVNHLFASLFICKVCSTISAKHTLPLTGYIGNLLCIAVIVTPKGWDISSILFSVDNWSPYTLYSEFPLTCCNLLSTNMAD